MRPADLLQLLVLALLWGGSYLFIRVAVPAFGPASLVAVRLLLGAVLLWVFALLLRRPLALRAHWRPLLVLGALNAAVPYLLISAAELHVTASFAALLNATAPLFAALFGAYWLAERLTPWRLVGLFGGIVGVGIVVGWSPFQPTLVTLLSMLAILAAAACYAGSGVYVRRRLRDVPVHTLALGQQVGALAWLLVPGIAWAPATLPGPAPVAAVLALGVLSTAVAYLLYFRLLVRIGPTRTATVTYIVPLAGILWGAVFLDEPVSGGMIAGLVVIIASVALLNEVRLPVRARSQAGERPARARAA